MHHVRRGSALAFTGGDFGRWCGCGAYAGCISWRACSDGAQV